VGDAIELNAGGYRAVVDPRGAALRRLTWRDRDLVWPYTGTEGPTAFQGQFLAPWPNRIADGRYVFAGTEYRLPVTEPARGTALHGFAHAEPWRTTGAAPDRAALALDLAGVPGYPFRLELAVDYTLDAADGLAVRVRARNAGASPAPYGNGFHPYLRVGGALADAVLRLPGSLRLPVDGRLLPAGPPEPVAGTEHDFRVPRRVGATVFDTAFTGLDRGPDGLAWSVLSGGGTSVGLWADRSYGWLQVFSADGLPEGLHRSGLAVEPMTCPPNAFASGHDLTVLEPGAEARSAFGIRVVDTAP
jgi:aldose 1-epimerase